MFLFLMLTFLPTMILVGKDSRLPQKVSIQELKLCNAFWQRCCDPAVSLGVFPVPL